MQNKVAFGRFFLVLHFTKMVMKKFQRGYVTSYKGTSLSMSLYDLVSISMAEAFVFCWADVKDMLIPGFL